MSTDTLDFDLNDDRWYDPEFGPMILHTQFGKSAKPLEILVDVFGIIEDMGLEVKRVVVPKQWVDHLPIEDGFLWGAFVADDVEDIAPIVAYSSRKNGRPIRTVTVSWAD